MNKKVFLTGVTGSGGSYLAEYITNNTNCIIDGSTRSWNDGNHKNLRKLKDKINLIYLDLTDFPALFVYFDNNRPDYVLHIASLASIKHAIEAPYHTIKNNIDITLNLLEALRILKNKDGYNPITVICSSSEVFGNPDIKYIPLKEDAPLAPANSYSCSKLFQDSISNVYHTNYGLNIIRTRMFSYLNSKRKDLFASSFAYKILDVKNGKRKFVDHGNLSSIRSLICADEAAESYWVAATKGKIGQVYNIGGIEQISVGGVLQKLIELSGVEIPTKENESLLRPKDISIQIPDITLFTNDTGWKPRRNLNESINHFWNEVCELYEG